MTAVIIQICASAHQHALQSDGVCKRCILPADFKQALGQQSSRGPAPPCKLTAHQTQIVKALIEAHADDVEVTPFPTIILAASNLACCM